MITRFLTKLAPALLIFTSVPSSAQSPVKTEQEALIPKRETGVLEFLKKHPSFDGRDTVIAIFDTGVDPAADGLQKTSTGQRKIVDVIDATGSGDVNTSHTAEASKKGTLEGLTGRTLTLPKKLRNPSKKFHLGIKRARDLFHPGVSSRLSRLRNSAWQNELANIRNQRSKEIEAAQRENKRQAFDKAPADLTLKEKDQIAREQLLESLENNYASSDPGPVYDCVVWSDGKHFRVLIDTDEDGDLRDEKPLRPFGIAGDFGYLSREEASTFAVQVYDEGNLLSIVTVSGSHGSHVASIAAAHFPDESHRDGVAPGARILSVKIGDTRIGGSSSGVGEMRGVAACAQYNVDIMNASWGGASQYQDGKTSRSKLYNMLAEKYGITAFISAGNSGPALSTLGSSGGDTSTVIGVGAYVSSEMSRILYSQTTPGPNTAFQFSSRGPCKNGDLGVDIMGPGAANASLAYDELQKSERYNGTSMSSPSVAGLGALLISGAKQSKIKHSPARLRAALMNSARFIKEADVFAQGAGLVQALPAWNHLKANAKESTWDHFFDIVTNNNTFSSGPGLYLRGDIPVGKKEVRFDLSPKFTEKITAPEKFALQGDLIFTATQPWVKIPNYARLANGRITIRPVLDIPATQPGQPLYAEIHARLANQPKGGPLLRIPITILRGEKTDPHLKHRGQYSLNLESGNTDRRFYQVPPHANFMKVRLRRDASDSLNRYVLLHAVTVIADNSYYAYNSQNYLALESQGEKEILIPVTGGKTTELALHQPFYSVGKTSLHVDFQFLGMSADQDLVVFHENDNHAPLRIITASDETVRGEASINRAHFSQMPLKNEFLMPDSRETFPSGPNEKEALTAPFLRQTYTLSVDKPTKITLEQPRSYNIREEIEGGLITAYHESGKLLYPSGASRSADINLPKGKTTVYRILKSPNRSLLERQKNQPLNWSIKLPKPKNLDLFESGRSVAQGRKTGTISLTKGRHQSLFLGAPDLASLASQKPTPLYFSGRVKLIQTTGSEAELLSLPVECHPGTELKSTANQKKKPQSLETPKKPLEKLESDLFQRQLTFVKANKFTDKKDLQKRRNEMLATLFKAQPKNADIHLLHAEIHAAESRLLSDLPQSDAKPQPKAVKPVFDILKKVQNLSKPAQVAAYFGARSEADDAPLEERKKASKRHQKMEQNRKRLATIATLRADIHLNTANFKAARTSLREARRWEDQPSKKYKKVELALLKAEKHFGLALQKVNALLKDSPFDQKILTHKIDLFEKLGFDERFTRRLQLQQKLNDYRLEKGGQL